MKKKKTLEERHSKTDPINNPAIVIIIGILGFLMGVFFIVMQSGNKPIRRTEAVAYSGEFQEYEIWNDYRTIYLSDGSEYNVYTHTESREFSDKMKSLEAGTMLYILVNPNNDYVIELKTDTEELINFDVEQAEINAYANGYIGIGIFACVAGAFCLIYGLTSAQLKKLESKRRKDRLKVSQKESSPIRYAKQSVKGRTLLEARSKGYEICYYRVDHINELIINGKVYDEKKALVECEHELSAVVGGHRIDAGLDEERFSYIKFDGKTIATKKRLL